jgi:hypothetical protein
MVLPGAVLSFTKVVVLPYRKYADALRCDVGGPSGIGSSKPLLSGFERPEFWWSRACARVLRRLHIFTDPDKRRPYHEREIPGPAGENNLWDGARVYRLAPDGSLSVLATIANTRTDSRCRRTSARCTSPTLALRNTSTIRLDDAGNMVGRRAGHPRRVEGRQHLPGFYCTGPGGWSRARG